MFDNINKKLYTQSIENSAKRHNFRVEIRRKAVQSYQQRIRTQWSQDPIGSNMQHKNYQSPPKTRFITHDSIAEYQTFSIQNTQILQKLQQLSLTQGSQLCQIENINILIRNLSNTNNFKLVQQRISRILIKICISQIYWTQQFLALLFLLLMKFAELGADCSEFIINLSECADLEMKVIIYGMMIGSGILEKQVCNQKNMSKQKCSKYKTMRILNNFLLVAPIVSHTHPFLKQSSTSDKNYFIEKLLLIMNIAFETVSNENCLKRSINKQHYSMLQLFYGICNRMESRQLHYILPLLKNNSWKLFDNLTCKFGVETTHKFSKTAQNECDVYSKPMDIKIKYKIMQCVQTILRFCISEQKFKQEGLQFFYNFLPTILNIIVQDIPQTAVMKKENLQKYSAQYYSNKFDQKYEYLLLQVIYTLLNVRDHLNQVPVLEFISATYPFLFQTIFNYFGRHQPEPRKAKLLAWIFEILNNEVNHICELGWANQFVEDTILQDAPLSSTETILISVLQTVQYILINQDHQGKNCRIFNTMNNSLIHTRLSSLLELNQELNPNLICTIDNILTIIGKQQPY